GTPGTDRPRGRADRIAHRSHRSWHQLATSRPHPPRSEHYASDTPIIPRRACVAVPLYDTGRLRLGNCAASLKGRGAAQAQPADPDPTGWEPAARPFVVDMQ